MLTEFHFGIFHFPYIICFYFCIVIVVVYFTGGFFGSHWILCTRFGWKLSERASGCTYYTHHRVCRENWRYIFFICAKRVTIINIYFHHTRTIEKSNRNGGEMLNVIRWFGWKSLQKKKNFFRLMESKKMFILCRKESINFFEDTRTHNLENLQAKYSVEIIIFWDGLCWVFHMNKFQGNYFPLKDEMRLRIVFFIHNYFILMSYININLLF